MIDSTIVRPSAVIPLAELGASIGESVFDRDEAGRVRRHKAFERRRLRPNGRNIYEKLGSGFTLLSLEGNTGQSFAHAAAPPNILLKLSMLSTDPPAGFMKWGLILFRPDQFMAWRSNVEVNDPCGVLKHAVGGSM